MTYTNKTQPTAITLYDLMGREDYKKDLENLGKHTFSGQSCLAIKSLKGINLKISGPVIKRLLTDMKKRYKTERETSASPPDSIDFSNHCHFKENDIKISITGKVG